MWQELGPPDTLALTLATDQNVNHGLFYVF